MDLLPSYYRTAWFWYHYIPRRKTEPTSVNPRLLNGHFMTYWSVLSSFRVEITCLKVEQRIWVRARRVINTIHLVPGRLVLAPLDPLSPQSNRVHVGGEVQMCHDESCRGDRRLRNTSTAHPPQKMWEYKVEASKPFGLNLTSLKRPDYRHGLIRRRPTLNCRGP